MKVLSIIFLIGFTNSCCTHAQEETTTPDQLIEGGKLILDLVREIKGREKRKQLAKSRRSASCEDGLSQVCFTNNLEIALLVRLSRKLNPDSVCAVLVIPEGNKECSYFSTSEVFIYEAIPKIRVDSGHIFQKGELMLKKCEVLIKSLEMP